MKSTHWILAAVAAVILGFSAPALADHEKGHHDGKGKWGHYCKKDCNKDCDKDGKKGCDWMDPEKRKLVQEAMGASREKNMELSKSMMQRHKAMDDVLAAKDFDKNAFLVAFRDLSDARTAMQRNRAEAFADVAGQLTPEERKKMGMFLGGGVHSGMMHKRGGHHGKWGKKEGCDKPQAQEVQSAPVETKPSSSRAFRPKRGALNE